MLFYEFFQPVIVVGEEFVADLDGCVSDLDVSAESDIPEDVESGYVAHLFVSLQRTCIV